VAKGNNQLANIFGARASSVHSVFAFKGELRGDIIDWKVLYECSHYPHIASIGALPGIPPALAGMRSAKGFDGESVRLLVKAI